MSQLDNTIKKLETVIKLSEDASRAFDNLYRKTAQSLAAQNTAAPSGAAIRGTEESYYRNIKRAFETGVIPDRPAVGHARHTGVVEGRRLQEAILKLQYEIVEVAKSMEEASRTLDKAPRVLDQTTRILNQTTNRVLQLPARAGTPSVINLGPPARTPPIPRPPSPSGPIIYGGSGLPDIPLLGPGQFMRGPSGALVPYVPPSPTLRTNVTPSEANIIRTSNPENKINEIVNASDVAYKMFFQKLEALPEKIAIPLQNYLNSLLKAQGVQIPVDLTLGKHRSITGKGGGEGYWIKGSYRPGAQPIESFSAVIDKQGGVTSKEEFDTEQSRLYAERKLATRQQNDAIRQYFAEERASAADSVKAQKDRVAAQQEYFRDQKISLKRTIEESEATKAANSKLDKAYLKQKQQLLDYLEKTPDKEATKAALGEYRTGQVEKLMSKRGLGWGDLSKVTVNEPSGVATFRWKREEGGITKENIATVDTYGQVLEHTNRRLLGFTESVARNTVEFIKWSIGVTLVYGTIQKLSELIQIAIDNQTKLADVTVALGAAQRDVNAIFADAATIAEQTGESISGVLESYVMAYRAVGAVADPIEKTAAANKLLTDSTILNKLSGLDAAESIDVLSGSLRQMQGPQESVTTAFGRGTDLLDKWVKLTRVANVDMATLATAFSVTAESAMNAGMSMEELNATIAILAEKIGGLGGKETGNAVRALVGGVYQEQAAKALSTYGIAVQNSSGQMRNFLDISKDIYQLYKQGIIDETQLNKIAYVLGGGVRRGQQYVAFLSELSRVGELAAEQFEAGGEAQRALAIKMDTVQTATTKLSNSFQKLAQSLGTKGGVLDTIAALTTGLSKVIELITIVSSGLGRVAVPATLVALLSGWSRASEPNALKFAAAQNFMFGRVGNVIGNRFGTPGSELQSKMSGRAVNTMTGAVLAAYPAISRAGEGNYKAAAADAGGAIVGALVGSLGGTTGAMIGGQIGSFMADTFVTEVLQYEPQLSNLFSNLFTPTPKEAEKLDKNNLAAEYAIDFTGKFTTWAANKIQNAGVAANQFFGGKLKSIDQEQTAFGNLLTMGTPEEIAEFYRLLEQDRKKTVEDIAEADTTFYKTQAGISSAPGFSATVDQLAIGFRKALFEKQSAGLISSKDYRTGVGETFGLGSNISRIQTALKMGGVGGYDVEKLANISMYIGADDRAAITALVSEIEDYYKIIDQLEGKDPSQTVKDLAGEAINYSQAIEKATQKTSELDSVLQGMEKVVPRNIAAAAKTFGILSGKGYTKDEGNRILEIAKQLQQRELNEQITAGALTSSEAQAKIAAADPLLVDLGEQWGYLIAKGLIDSKFWEEAIDKAKEEGITSDLGIGYQFMDVTKAQMDAIDPQYQALRKAIVNAGGTSEEEGLVTLFKDSSSPVYMQKDWKIVQYLLQQILDVNEKQLDGMYNLPSGASFYVPFQAWAMDKETRMASAEKDVSLDARQFDTSVNAFDAAVEKFIQNADARTDRKQEELEKTMQEPGVTGYTKPPPSAMPQAWGVPLFEGPQGPPPGTMPPPNTGATINGKPAAEYGQELLDSFKGMFSGYGLLDDILQGLLNKLVAPDLNTNPTSAIPQTNAAPVTTALNLNFNSQTQLIVDGRVLADVVKPYLMTDMVNYENSAGSASRSFTSL